MHIGRRLLDVLFGQLHKDGDAGRRKALALEVRFAALEKLMALGGYPEQSLAEAERHAGRRLLAAGVDPMARRMAAKVTIRDQSGTSFEAIATLWMEHWKEGKSLRHVGSTWRRLDANILPPLGAFQIVEI